MDDEPESQRRILVIDDNEQNRALARATLELESYDIELASGGQAKFTTRSNLGNPELDRAVESSMSLDSARWTNEGANFLVTGAAKDGKQVTYKFLGQQNGDLV